MAKKLRAVKSSSDGKKQETGKHATRQRLYLFIFFLITALLYLHNLTRDIYSGDIGDLVTASYFMGVAHPPGYPLFMILGFFFSHLPLPLPPVTKVAFISLIASLLGLYFYFKLSQRLTKDFFISLFATSVLAFSYLFWLYAEIPEVFGLNNLFVILLFYFTVSFYLEKKIHYLYVLGFFTGLSLTHHHTIVFIFPSLIFLLLTQYKFLLSHKKQVGYAFLFFILGLSVYLYVPFAAVREPLINWDHAWNLENFKRLILREDYGGAAPNIVNDIPYSIKLIQVGSYFKTLISVFSYQIIFLAIIGLIALFQKDKKLFVTFLSAFILAGPFFVYYGTRPYTTEASMGIIERFYVLSSIICMYFVPLGLSYLKQLLDRVFSRRYYSTVILCYFLIVPLFLLYYNYPKTDLSTTQIGNRLAEDILTSLPPNAILYVSGDTTLFNIWYNQFVLGKRKDVNLISPAGVAGNKYLDDQINTYYEKHPKTDLPQILPETMVQLRKSHRIFTTYTMPVVPHDSFLLPRGLTMELVYKKDLPTVQEFTEEIEPLLKKYHPARRQTLAPNERNLVATEIPTIYSNALIHIGDFVDQQYKDYTLAEHYYRRGLWIDEENPSGYAGLALVQFKGAKDCPQAINNMKTAIEIYPIWEQYYLQLFTLYQRCHRSEKEITPLKKQYQNIFHQTIEEGVKKRYGSV